MPARRRVLAVAVALAGLIAAGLVIARRPRSDARPALAQTPRRLDVQAFRDHVERSRRKALALRSRVTVPPAYVAPEMRQDLLVTLFTPQCVLGPGSLCHALADVANACGAGDAASCLAAAQYVEDTPPRSLIAPAWYQRACKLGEEQACRRLDEIRAFDGRCEHDLLACALRAMKAGDDELADAACVGGVADMCALLAWRLEDEPDLALRYLVEACQLGNPMACESAAPRLPADQAAEARAIACAAGFGDGCT